MQRYTDQPATLELPDVLPPAAEGRRTVLLLEDDVQFKEVIQEFLAGQGFDVVAVQNGVEGVHEVLA